MTEREPTEASKPSRAAAAARPTSLLAGAAVTYASNLGVALFSLGNVVLVSRGLGPVGRGEVVFLTTMAFLTSNVATLGVQEANANFGGSQPQLRPRLATNSILLSLVLGAAAAALLAALIALFPAVGADSNPGLRALVLATLPALILYVHLQLLLQADYRFGITNAAWILGPLVTLAVNGVLYGLGSLTVGRALSAWILGQLLQTAVLLWFVARRSSGLGHPDRALARRTLSFGAKAHAGRLMTLGNYRLDQWLLGAIAGPRQLGLYSVAVAWSEVLFYLPTVLTMLQRPALVRSSAEEAVPRARSFLWAALVLAIPSAVVLVVAAPLLCVSVFGERFADSVDDLRILAAGALGMTALKILGNALTAQRRPLRATAGVAAAFAATVLLDVALIPPLGGRGAAIASTLAYTVGGIAMVVIFTRTFGRRVSALLPVASDRAYLRRLRADPSTAPRHATPEDPGLTE